MMVELYKFRINDQGRENRHTREQQLSLLFDTQSHAGNLVCIFEQDIQPSTIADIILREGISCLIDLRRVPFFSGDGQRHKLVNNLLNERGIPVFHVGVAYFSAIDQSLPNTLKISQLSDFLDNSKEVHETVVEYLNRGACLIVIDGTPDVIEFTKLIVSFISSIFSHAQIKLNKSWSQISKTRPI